MTGCGLQIIWFFTESPKKSGPLSAKRNARLNRARAKICRRQIVPRQGFPRCLAQRGDAQPLPWPIAWKRKYMRPWRRVRPAAVASAETENEG